MGDSPDKKRDERRGGTKDRRDESEDRRGAGRVETETEQRRKEKDRRKE